MTDTSGIALIFKGESALNSNEYEEALLKLNLKCISIPPITFDFCNIDEAKSCLFSAFDYNGMILTSPRAVEALAHIVEKNQTEWSSIQQIWKNLYTFVVGSKTNALAESLLGLKTIGSDSGNSEALASYIQQVPELTKPLFFPCGNLRHETLPVILSKLNINIESLTVYQTICHPDLEDALQKIAQKENPQYLIYFSPSGVKFTFAAFREINFPLEKCKLVAIGPTTANAIRSFGLEVYCVANKPNPDDLMQAIAEHLSHDSQHALTQS